MTLITQDRWDLVKHEVDIEDRVPATLTQPVGGNDLVLRVSDVSVFNADEALRIGEERLTVVSVQNLTRDAAGALPRDRSGGVTVRRGVLGTTPLEHPAETVIYRFPLAPDPPSINQASCGQTAQPPAPPGTPELVEPFTGQTVEVTALNLAFSLREIRATAGTGNRIRVRLDNRDASVEHNIAFYQSATSLTPVATGSIGTRYPGPGVDDTVFDVPAAGSYFFRCDVHPTTMTGNFIVQ
jgi:plastocyanin